MSSTKEKKETQEQIKKAVKDYVAAKKKEEIEVKDEDAIALEEMLQEASMPIALNDEEFKCGPQELDIRGLSKKNKEQLIFRILTLQGVYLRNISKSLLDITNLLFVVLDQLGVKDIIKTSDDVLDKIAEENEQLQKLAKQVKKDKNK